jgi:glycosyltransferase involved in cell wall biosynthesis
MSNSPKVSVIIPIYNMAGCLEKCLKSVMTQTFQDFEVLIVNDGSTDGLKEIVKNIADGEKIRYLEQKNKGISSARNLGIKNARGKYIAFLDVDDEWLPDKLQRQVGFLEKNEQCGLSYCDAYKINASGKVAGKCREKRMPYRGRVCRQLFYSNFIVTSSVMVRKALLERAGLFDETIMIHDGEDFDLWLRLSMLTEFAFTNIPLVKYILPEPTHRNIDRLKNRIFQLQNYEQKYPQYFRKHDPYVLLGYSAAYLKLINGRIRQGAVVEALKRLGSMIIGRPSLLPFMAYLFIKGILIKRIY